MNRSNTKEILTLKELADYLHCHVSTIYRLLSKNQLPAFRVGSDWRFRLDAIQAWCEAQSGKEPVSEPGLSKPKVESAKHFA